MALRLTPSTCFSSRQALRKSSLVWSLSRNASSSTPTSTYQIPPESPKFIEIPMAPQRQARVNIPVKGVLPVPRQIFPRGSADKTSPPYLAAVTLEPTSKKDMTSIDPSTKDYIEWKARSAAVRRRNLREGLVELQHRKQRIDRRLAASSAFKQAENYRALHQSEREDERFTNPSITHKLTPGYLANIPDPDRKKRIAKKKAKVKSKETREMEERRSALHSLYMNARDFIVTEAALNTKIDEVFDEEWFKNNPGRSIWDRENLPHTVQSLLHEANRSGYKAVQHNAGYAKITRERVQRIAEELTGGKM
ncbi:MAG: hypothetical protein Q9187_004484 [Circinaria calcarea]